MKKIDHGNILSMIMWLIALHSFIAGIGLIVMPPQLMESLGFNSGGDRFFQSQVGVFHIVMAIAYSLAAFHVRKNV
jgi:hypothetical protein